MTHARPNLKSLVRACLWWLLFATLFLVAAHLPYFRDIHKQYTAFVLAFLWLAVALGFDHPLRPVWITSLVTNLQRLVCRWPLYAVPVLVCVTVGSFIWIYHIAHCLFVSTRYQTHLASYSSSRDVAHLTAAFTLLPRRQDAMILFEKHLLSLSTETAPGGLRRTAGLFADDPRVVAVFKEEAVDKNAHCLCDDSKTWQDPALWYAMVLPMAEGHEDTERKLQARRLLSARAPHVPSQIFTHVLDLELFSLGAGPDRTDELRALIADVDELHASHLVQEALDHLAQYELYGNDCDISGAIKNYRMLLDRREQVARANPHDRIWVRSPRKLSLYHMFRAIRHPARAGETISKAHELFQLCPGLQKAIKTDLYDVFTSYRKEEKWYTNTLVGPGVSKEILESWPATCWRY